MTNLRSFSSSQLPVEFRIFELGLALLTLYAYFIVFLFWDSTSGAARTILHYVVWQDTKPVRLLSTEFDATVIGTMKRTQMERLHLFHVLKLFRSTLVQWEGEP